MIKFIIIDDDLKMIDKIKKTISNAIFKYNLSYQFSAHTRYDNELTKEIIDDSFIKIYITDIELKDSKSGIEIAEEIREKDWESTIIFITSHDKMFETVYRNIYNIFDFIEKFQNMDSRLEKDIIEIAKHNFDTKTFKYSNRNIDFQIYLKSINYIYRDSNERKLVVKTNENEYYLSMNIADILDKLDSRFIRVHRSCIINSDNITKINWKKGYFEVKGNKKDLVYLASKKYKDEYKWLMYTNTLFALFPY